MIQTEKLRLEVDNYRAIRHANVTIGDIAVLSGVNASGKSTIAHLFHALVNLNRDYETLARKHAWLIVGRLMRPLGRMYRRLGSINQDRKARMMMPFSYRFDNAVERSRARKMVEDAIMRVEMAFTQALARDPDETFRCLDAMVREIEELDGKDQTLSSVMDWIRQQVRVAEDRFLELMANRVSDVWESVDYDVLKWIQYPGKGKLYEAEKLVCTLGDPLEKGLREILNIEHAFYIESPWRNLPDPDSEGRVTIHDGFLAEPVDPKPDVDRSLFAVLEGEITQPEEESSSSSSNEDGNEFGADGLMYARNDGHEPFPLEECATGIKSLSILNFLYTRGYLGRKTLLIVDEPEAHLHPQWILEYAKILVRLNRRLGVRLLITTHSPDMLNAIRRVANVEEVPDLRFYVAEPVSAQEKYDFNYRELGRNVEPIFAMFNLAADRTEAYPDDVIQ